MSKRDQFTVVAEQVPFDNDTNGFTAEDVQAAIEEVGISASPGFGFGRSGNVSTNTWLLRTGTVPSNKTGVALSVSNASITKIDVGNENINTFDISIYEHEGDEVNLTLLVTVSVINSRTASFDISDFGIINATLGRQLAVRLTSGSGKNIGVDVTLKGQQ